MTSAPKRERARPTNELAEILALFSLSGFVEPRLMNPARQSSIASGESVACLRLSTRARHVLRFLSVTL